MNNIENMEAGLAGLVACGTMNAWPGASQARIPQAPAG